MIIIEKATTPDGSVIQIEDWHKNYKFIPPRSSIGAYAKSKKTKPGAFSPNKNEMYRFGISFDSADEAQAAFDELIDGTKTLKDYASRCKYGDCL